MDEYEIGSRHYDASYAQARTPSYDVDFYVELATRSGGRVLEVACGTGRVLLPTARAGVEIVGLDLSPAMLERLTAKLADEPDVVRRRVQLHEGDMRTFKLDERFALITVPFRPLQHLYTLEDQLATFGNLREHLADGGRLVFDVFNPKLTRIEGGVGESIQELTWPDPVDDDVEWSREYIKREVHRLEQWFAGDFVFRATRAGKVVDEHTERLKMSFYLPYQLELIFRLVGLRVVERFGDFERCPFGDGDELVYVVERA